MRDSERLRRRSISGRTGYSVAERWVRVTGLVLLLTVAATRANAKTCSSCTTDVHGNACSTGFCDVDGFCCATNNDVCDVNGFCCTSGSLNPSGVCVCNTDTDCISGSICATPGTASCCIPADITNRCGLECPPCSGQTPTATPTSTPTATPTVTSTATITATATSTPPM